VRSKNRFWSNDLGHFFERFAAQSFGSRSQADVFRIGEPYLAFDLTAQDSVFGHQILISRQKLLVDGAYDVREHSLPVHRANSTSAFARMQFLPPFSIRRLPITTRSRAVGSQPSSFPSPANGGAGMKLSKLAPRPRSP